MLCIFWSVKKLVKVWYGWYKLYKLLIIGMFENLFKVVSVLCLNIWVIILFVYVEILSVKFLIDLCVFMVLFCELR